MCTVTKEGSLLSPFKAVLLRTCGLQFENEREKTLMAGIARRMSGRGITAEEDYLALLEKDREEFQRLVELLTVNETYFFREPEQLKVLVEKIVPELLRHKSEPVRIVSAGCSTGEEPYSLAMLLREHFGAGSENLATIAGVDIDAAAIAKARGGVYGAGSFRGMNPAVRERYFMSRGPGIHLSEEIRRQVAFEVVNLLGNAYPPILERPDVILYRNVSIYFPSQVQREIFGHLAALLNDEGYLIVGTSETMHHDIGVLSLVERDSLFFYRKGPPGRLGDRRSERRTPRRNEAVLARPRPAGAATPAPIRMHRVAAVVDPPRPIGRGPLSSRRAFDDALALALDRQFDEALMVLDALIERDPSFIKAWSLKGSILMSASRFQEARELCMESLQQDPFCLEAFLVLGITARHLGDDEEARRRFREAIYLRPTCWLAHFYLAEIVFGQGDRKRAGSGYEAALRILREGSSPEHGRELFPLFFNAEEFIAICSHKLSVLQEEG